METLVDADLILDDGPPRQNRRCAATGARDDRARLLRFVVSPDGEVTPDVDGRLPGRGLWVAANRRALADARKGRFARAARRAVTCPDDLDERVERLLARRCVESIGLARRGGRAVFGFEKVRAQFAPGAKWVPALLLHASDAAADGRRKLAGLAEVCETTVLDGLSGEELGQAFARGSVAHGAIGAGPLADRLRVDLGRLAGLRME